MTRDLSRRVSALEEYIEKLVDERLEEEFEEMVCRLEVSLPRDEALKVMKILAGDEYLQSAPVERTGGRPAHE